MKNNPWENIGAPTSDVNARRIDHSHPLDFFWAKNYSGQYLFIYKFVSDVFPDIKFSSIKGISISMTNHINSNAREFVLTLNDSSNWEMFYSLCVDIAESTASINVQSNVLHIIQSRLYKWQHFFEAGKSPLLSEERIIGLLGELFFIKEYLSPLFGIKNAIRFWKGPKGYPQDFEVNNKAIELKSKSGTSRNSIRINSIDQLSSRLPQLLLCVITFCNASENSTDTIDLPMIISNLRSEITLDSDLMEIFNDLLLESGYFELEAYKKYKYCFSEITTYTVSDQFPSIRRDCLDKAIIKAAYEIDLSKCRSFIQNSNIKDVLS